MCLFTLQFPVDPADADKGKAEVVKRDGAEKGQGGDKSRAEIRFGQRNFPEVKAFERRVHILGV